MYVSLSFSCSFWNWTLIYCLCLTVSTCSEAPGKVCGAGYMLIQTDTYKFIHNTCIFYSVLSCMYHACIMYVYVSIDCICLYQPSYSQICTVSIQKLNVCICMYLYVSLCNWVDTGTGRWSRLYRCVSALYLHAFKHHTQDVYLNVSVCITILTWIDLIWKSLYSRDEAQERMLPNCLQALAVSGSTGSLSNLNLKLSLRWYYQIRDGYI